MRDDKIAILETVLYLLFLPLYPLVAMTDFRNWVGDNHDVLQTIAAWAGVLVAAGGVFVAVVYALLTRQLARAANEQAAASNEAARAAREQAEASRRGAEAAAAQARTTQQMFEAGHRPYVEARLDEASFGTRPDFYRLHVRVKNYGPMPADIIRWQLVFRRENGIVGGHGPVEELLSVFPNREQTLEARAGADAPEGHPPGPMEIEINIRYRGAYEA